MQISDPMSPAFWPYLGDVATMRPFATDSQVLEFSNHPSILMASFAAHLGCYWPMYDQWPDERAEVIDALKSWTTRACTN